MIQPKAWTGRGAHALALQHPSHASSLDLGTGQCQAWPMLVVMNPDSAMSPCTLTHVHSSPACPDDLCHKQVRDLPKPQLTCYVVLGPLECPDAGRAAVTGAGWGHTCPQGTWLHQEVPMTLVLAECSKAQ